MKFWGLLIGGAVSPYLFDSVLTTQTALVLLLLVSIIAWLMPVTRVYCLLPVTFLLVSLAIDARLEQRLPLSQNGVVATIEGRVASLPLVSSHMTSFIFEPLDPDSPYPDRIRVNWYAERAIQADPGRSMPIVHAGDHWRLMLELRSPRSRVNFYGMDAERWYFADGIGALGYVQGKNHLHLADPRWLDLQALRERLLTRLYQVTGTSMGVRVLAALAVADRRALLQSDRQVLSATGTGHLLAISGLHIGLAAAIGFYLGRFCLFLLSAGMRVQVAIILPWITALSAALSYAALAGFGVSTQRALVMLAVAALVSISRRYVHPLNAWLLAMALVLALDPFAPLRAGFWFSFLAVLVLLMLFVPRQGRMPFWKKALIAQLGISIMMAPLGMYWFQQASLPGLLANLVAIPLVSFVIVPLMLTGLMFLYLPLPVAAWALKAASQCCQWLFDLLELLSQLQPERLNTSLTPGFIMLVMALAGTALILLPRGAPGRLAGVLMLLPLLWPQNLRPAAGETRIDFLDVGQGMAVLLTSEAYQLLYDTGPGNGLTGEDGWDVVDTSIIPAIRANGGQPDVLIASHADLDHAGGLNRLRLQYPTTPVLASLPQAHEGVKACQTPLQWWSEHLMFSVLHPSPGLPYIGNDSSCVVSVKGHQFSLLLSGDISHVVEKRMVAQNIGAYDLLTVPHHGSSSSSSMELLEMVRPVWALVSAGIDNRFDFPRRDVLDRYAQIGSKTFDTASCGGLRLTIPASGEVKIESARNGVKTLWRWPAADGCP